MTFRIDCRPRGQRKWNRSRAVMKFTRRMRAMFSPQATKESYKRLWPNYQFRIVRLSDRRQETKPEAI